MEANANLQRQSGEPLAITIPRQVGIYVRDARTSQGITQRQLSWLSGVSERSIIALELGNSPGIRLDKLLAVLDALGMSLQVTVNPDFKAVAPAGPPQKEPKPKSYEEALRRMLGEGWDLPDCGTLATGRLPSDLPSNGAGASSVNGAGTSPLDGDDYLPANPTGTPSRVQAGASPSSAANSER